MAASYEVTDGTKVYGTFSSQAKADALKKELKAEGVKARVRITYDAKPAKTKKTAEPKIPKTVKKSTPKPVKPKPLKPKATQKKPKESPKVQEKPKDAPKKRGPQNKVKAKTNGFPIPPTDYGGSRVPLDYIKRALENTLDCIQPDGSHVKIGSMEIATKEYYVNVATLPVGRSAASQIYPYGSPKLESDGRYLKLTSRQGLVHWYLIEGGLDYPDVPVAPERPKIDCSTCSIEQLIDVLYEIQEPDVQFMEKREIKAALSNPSMTVGLCEQFLNHTLYTEQFFDRWEESGRTEKDVQALRSRLNRLKLEAESYIASTVPDEPPAPVEKPKKGLFKRKSRSKTGLAARADFFKRVGDPLARFGIKAFPVSDANFSLIDPSHIFVVEFRSRSGMSFFGLPDEGISVNGDGKQMCINLAKVRDNMASYYDADGNPIAARLKTDADVPMIVPKVPNLNMTSHFTLDPAAFKKELARAKKIVGHGSDWIILYSDGDDLMIRSESDNTGDAADYGIKADVGDKMGEHVEAKSMFAMEYLRVIADLLSQSDGPCSIDVEVEYPLVARCTIGDFDLTIMLAPRSMGR